MGKFFNTDGYCDPELKNVLYELLFNGKPIPFVATNSYMKDAAMFGFIRNEKDTVVISNRIFEAVLYNNFISEGRSFYALEAAADRGR